MPKGTKKPEGASPKNDSSGGDTLTKKVATSYGDTLTKKVTTLTKKVTTPDGDTLTKNVALEAVNCDAMTLEVLPLVTEEEVPLQGYLGHYRDLCSWLPGRQKQVELLLTIFGEVCLIF